MNIFMQSTYYAYLLPFRLRACEDGIELLVWEMRTELDDRERETSLCYFIYILSLKFINFKNINVSR